MTLVVFGFLFITLDSQKKGGGGNNLNCKSRAVKNSIEKKIKISCCVFLFIWSFLSSKLLRFLLHLNICFIVRGRGGSWFHSLGILELLKATFLFLSFYIHFSGLNREGSIQWIEVQKINCYYKNESCSIHVFLVLLSVLYNLSNLVDKNSVK